LEKDHFDPLPYTLPSARCMMRPMARNRIVVARPPARSRPKKVQSAAAAVTRPTIVLAQKPSLKRYTLPEAAEDPEADARVKAFFARMVRPRDG
jgi:hypothetical protein